MNRFILAGDNSQFTETERIVLQYIVDNQYDMSRMTINELAVKTSTSNATIIRLCRKMGFSGFRDFRVGIIKHLESKKYLSNNIDVNVPFYQTESTHDIINNIYGLYKESIDVVHANLDDIVIEKAVNELLQSQRIFIFAIGDSKITAMNFINKMIKIGIYPILATDNNEELSMCQNMTKKDCALFISYRGEYNSFSRCLEVLKEKNCRTITITANQKSTIAKESDIAILIPNKEEEKRIATFYSQLSFHYILNILYSLIYVQNYQD